MEHKQPVSRSAKAAQGGFTILLSALIASLVLALGVSVFSIAQKQLLLSSLGRNSQYAFYAADTAAECALFHDFRFDFASTTSPDTPIFCDGNTNIVVSHSTLPPPAGAGTYPVNFSFSFEPNGYCAQVTVIKNTVHPRTRITADGFSVPCAQIQTAGRTLQRTVELSY